jgi:hypothetical protein
MRLRLVDFSFICDKALDLYASTFLNCANRRFCGDLISIRKKELFSVIDSVIQSAECSCRKTASKLVICVGCYPLMRENCSKPTFLTRYPCKNDGYLRKIGISIDSFMGIVEKYIDSKCRYEKNDDLNGNVVFLKNKYTLADEWFFMIRKHYGSALVDDSPLDIFKDNPGFITSVRFCPSLFKRLPRDVEYKDYNIVHSLI